MRIEKLDGFDCRDRGFEVVIVCQMTVSLWASLTVTISYLNISFLLYLRHNRGTSIKILFYFLFRVICSLDPGRSYERSSEKHGVFRSFTNFGHMIALGLENISCGKK